MNKFLMSVTSFLFALNITASAPEVEHFTDSEEDIKKLSEEMSEQDKEKLMESISELRAVQAAFEIVSKSFGTIHLDDHLNQTSRYVIHQEREKMLTHMILNCSDERFVQQELSKCELISEEEKSNRLYSISYHCIFVVYALDGLADNIRLKEDKKFYEKWLLYLENTSAKVKQNLQLVINERFKTKS